MGVALVQARKSMQPPPTSSRESMPCALVAGSTLVLPSPLHISPNSQHSRIHLWLRETNLSEPNLLGFHRDLTDRGEENTQLQPPLAILSHLRLGGTMNLWHSQPRGTGKTENWSQAYRTASLPQHLTTTLLRPIYHSSFTHYIMFSFQQKNYKAY